MEKKVLNYRIIIEKEIYENGSPVYVAYCPTLGISDYGDTIEETLHSMKESIELTVESLAEHGEEVPIDHPEKQIITSTEIEVSPKLKISFT